MGKEIQRKTKVENIWEKERIKQVEIKERKGRKKNREKNLQIYDEDKKKR